MHSGKGIDLTKPLETTMENEKADVPTHTQKKFEQVTLKLINQGLQCLKYSYSVILKNEKHTLHINQT